MCYPFVLGKHLVMNIMYAMGSMKTPYCGIGSLSLPCWSSNLRPENQDHWGPFVTVYNPVTVPVSNLTYYDSLIMHAQDLGSLAERK